MDRLFGELVARGLNQNSADSRARLARLPAVDILERAEEFVMTVDLPGLEASDVELTVDKDQLTIRGERTSETTAEGETYRRVERFSGAFERTFKLSDQVDSAGIEARFKNGVMTVIAPKREETKPRVVEVNVEAN
jgi:HSP20 family protein